VLARHHLGSTQAGEYAVPAAVTRVAFWLPHGLGVVLLPRGVLLGAGLVRLRQAAGTGPQR
jgi:hypothetical protein